MIDIIIQQLASLAGSVLAEESKPTRPGRVAAMAPAVSGPNLLPFYTGGQGNFPYYWQDPNSLLFNNLTYNWINANLRNNTPPISQYDDLFTNYFINALGSISYSLSTADSTALTAAKENAMNQQMALLVAWRSAFGKIPVATQAQQPIDIILTTICTTWATPPVNLTILQNATNLNTVLNNTPASGKTVLPALGAYLTALDGSISLINSATMNTGYLQAALAAVQSPTNANGGITANDNLVYPAFSVNTPLQDIINGLNNAANTITMDITVSRINTTQASVSVNGGPNFTANIDDLFSIEIDANPNYFADILSMSGAPVELNLTFTGVTMVYFGPVSFNMATAKNWYWMKPIRDAIANGTQDVSGFKFSPNPGIDFTNAGHFGFLTAAAISNEPIVQVKAANVSSSTIKAALQNSSTVKLSVLNTGLGGSSDTYSLNYPPATNSGNLAALQASVVLNSAPPAPGASGSSLNSVAWVHGVLTNFPAA